MPARKIAEDYHKLAERRGFKWLGPEVNSVVIRTTWKCSKGHQWEARYYTIYSGKGCPYCAGKIRKTPEDYHKMAQAYGFKWIGPEVKSVIYQTTWECIKGHQWKARYNNIQGGQGCPYCAGKARKIPQDYHDLAKGRGFKWLGPEVKGAKFKTTWECGKGHQWEAKYNAIKDGRGCPYCPENAPKLPQDYHNLARERRFKWVGPEVKSVTTKTTWECSRGHRWEAVYSSVQQGSGCPVCNESKGEKRVAEVLRAYHIPFARQKRFDACRNKKYRLPFDFYFQVGDRYFLVEYQGRQHYEPISIFGGEKGLSQRQRLDRIKADFAKEYGFILITIPYTEHNHIHSILRQAIETHTGKSINDLINMTEGNPKTKSRKLDLTLYTQATF